MDTGFVETELCHHFQSVAPLACFFPDAGTISVESCQPLAVALCAAQVKYISYKIKSRYLSPLFRRLLLLLGLVLPHQERRGGVLVRRPFGPRCLLLWLLRRGGEEVGYGRLCAFSSISNGSRDWRREEVRVDTYSSFRSGASASREAGKSGRRRPSWTTWSRKSGVVGSIDGL